MHLKYLKAIFTVILFFSYATSLSAKTKITWWNYSDEGGGLDSNLKELVQDKFNASQNEIELEIVFKDGNINDNTRTALLAGVGPDIITSSGSSYVKAYHDAGLLLSLEKYSNEYGWKDIIYLGLIIQVFLMGSSILFHLIMKPCCIFTIKHFLKRMDGNFQLI